MVKIETALISMSDKRGLDKLVKALGKYNVKIISTGGTAQKIRELGYANTVDISEYTGFPESPGGYVKTLHPKIHGGLLLNEKNPEHAKYMKENGVAPINLVVVNLYPFEKTAVKKDVTEEEVFEQIDIGGPAMVRSAAKGALLYENIAIVINPSQYDFLIRQMDKGVGSVGRQTVIMLAREAFRRTASYDKTIVNFLDGKLENYIEKKYGSE